MYLEKQKAKADATFYSTMRTIEAENDKITPQYLDKLAFEAFSNTQFVTGGSIPDPADLFN